MSRHPTRIRRPRAIRTTRRRYEVEGLEPRTLLSLPPMGPQFLVHTPANATDDENVWNDRAVAMDATGDFVVVWTVWENGGPFTGSVQAQRFDSRGAARGARILVPPRPAGGPPGAGGAGGQFFRGPGAPA